METVAFVSIWPDTSLGHRPMLHVHGWCCDHRAMLPVARAFPSRPHLLVDLPGHGRSPAAKALSIEEHARALLPMLKKRVILVGHSMGAQVAVALAAAAPPGAVAGAILLDPAHLVPTDKAMQAAETMRARLFEHQPGEIVRAFARAQLAGPVADSAAFDALVEAMAATPAGTARTQWEEMLAYARSGAAARALAGIAAPVLAIACATPVNRLSDLARANPTVMTGQVAGAGHMLQFEAMDQVAAMVRRWLRLHAIDSA